MEPTRSSNSADVSSTPRRGCRGLGSMAVIGTFLLITSPRPVSRARVARGAKSPSATAAARCLRDGLFTAMSAPHFLAGGTHHVDGGVAQFEDALGQGAVRSCARALGGEV